MTIADGRLRFSELQSLFLIADLFQVNQQMLNKIYRDITNKDLPPSPDFGSRSWWLKNYGKRKAKENFKEDKYPSELDMERLRALAFLGLDEDATREEIRQAYLRMVQIHHPDKYFSLGEEAVRAAEKTFIRINASYDF